MTDIEINSAIAESIGQRYHKPTEAEIKSGSYYQYEPKFCNDLNAMHQVVQILSPIDVMQPDGFMKNQRGLFNITLERVLAETVSKEAMGQRYYFDIINASARHRAEAFLRTIGKWKD